ncbi:hypothetical protein Lal_00046983 [Lupinus albus]|uniref:Uncharacterized protein n=1 Tax=Lupinus albus TaxID=3870 RepID=A0A6A5MUB0_LUPAL|nr:hypothetical protein Lalb_Chr02g0152721 [Lupinus albus]KAF1878316.1 hypothetical protein Lal_00046983 [Lupinus albus]
MPIIATLASINYNYQLLYLVFHIFKVQFYFKASHKMYPRVKVRITEEEEVNIYQENDVGTWMFLKFIESLYLEGILKTSQQVGESPKENVRASSIIRPRAVLSSPENDELVGSINDLNNNISSTHRKNDSIGNVGKSLIKEGGEVPKGKTLLKAKCTSASFSPK